MPRRNAIGDGSGTAAVEFALLAPVFFGLLLAIFETGMFYFVNSAVKLANENAARAIRTGQAQGAMSQAQFFDEICNVVKVFGNCDEKLAVEVKRYDDFAALAADTAGVTCRDSSDPDGVSTAYEPGDSYDIIQVRVCFLQRTFTPFIGTNFDHTGDGNMKLVSTVIFRNEPFNN